MGALRQRLSWTDAGALQDGPRRYLMMRTDVLMGTLQRLPAPAQAAWLQAWAASTREHGAASLQAYAAELAASSIGADDAALINSTVQAAADLGWGRWQVAAHVGGLQLQVHGSPFVHGWRSAAASPSTVSTQPVCAPIVGLFSALACMLLHGPADVVESCCAATQTHAEGSCSFLAHRLPA